MSNESPESPEHHTRSAVEWIVGAVSGLAVVALIVFLFHQAAFRVAQPPALTVAIEGIEQGPHGTVVKVAVANHGDDAAAGVRVRATHAAAAQDLVHKQIEFDYVAGHGIRRGSFVFSGTAVSASDVEIEIEGFVEP